MDSVRQRAETYKEHSVAEIAELVGGTIHGDANLVINGVGSLHSAASGRITFILDDSLSEAAAVSKASCVIVPEGLSSPAKTYIQVAKPKFAFIKVVELFHPQQRPEPGIHPSAVVASSAVIGEGVHIGPFCVIHDNVSIGNGTVLQERVSVGANTEIGEDCDLHANVCVYDGVLIGNRVVMQAACVIGSDGFGYVKENGRYHKLQQLGNVRIEDDVELGASVCIDRGTLDETVIMTGTKIDNQGHVAHNVVIGRHCALAAQAGIAGSARIEDHVVFGGKVGVGDRAVIEEGATVAGFSAVSSGKRVHARQTVWGLPARPFEKLKKQQGLTARLPRIIDELKGLQQRIRVLESEGLAKSSGSQPG